MHRPVFFNLTQIQMPVGALTSITHRVTGILLACGIPLSAWVLGLSLHSPQSYARLLQLLDQWPARLVAILFVWALAHHVLAGVRHLLGDIDVGSTLPAARRSAWAVNIGGVVVALLAAGALF